MVQAAVMRYPIITSQHNVAQPNSYLPTYIQTLPKERLIVLGALSLLEGVWKLTLTVIP